MLVSCPHPVLPENTSSFQPGPGACPAPETSPYPLSPGASSYPCPLGPILGTSP